MPFRRVDLPATIPGSLWLHAMPGRLESWDAFLAEARRTGLSLLVCLNPRHELTSMSPAYDEAISQDSLPMRWLHLPMRNFGMGSDIDTFRAGIDQIVDALTDGGIVMMHCAAGIGRTGTAAACVLKKLGFPEAHAVQCVRTAGSNPESAVQSGLVGMF